MPDSRQIIPSSFVDELLYWRDQITQGCWRIGDICNEVKALAMANSNGYEIIGVEQIEHDIAEIVGKSANTVRLYARVCSFFPPEIRAQYPADIPFSHYRWAISLGERWKEALDLSAKYFTDTDAVRSVSFLDHEIERVAGKNCEESHDYQPIIADLPSMTPVPGDRIIELNMESAGVSDLESSPFENPNVLTADNAWEEIDKISDVLRDRLAPVPGLLERLAKLTGEFEITQQVARLTVSIRTLTDSIINQRPGGPGSNGAYAAPEDNSYREE